MNEQQFDEQHLLYIQYLAERKEAMRARVLNYEAMLAGLTIADMREGLPEKTDAEG